MSLPEFSLKNKYTIYALSIAVLIFGTVAYYTLPIQLFPDTSPPLVNVLTPYAGAAAEDVADLVSDPIETEAATLEGVYKVTSTSQDGLSLVEVEFTYDTDVDIAAVDVQNAITRIRGKLPKEIDEPQIMKISTSDAPVLSMGLISENLVDVRRLAEDVLAPELQRVRGVSVVDVFGGYQPEISIRVNRDRLEAHRLNLGMVVSAIRSHNVSVPAGKIKSEGLQYTFRVNEQSQNMTEIEKIPITTPTGKRILIGDIAKVEQGSGEDLSLFRVNGKEAVAMQVFKQDNANTVDVVLRAQKKFKELNERHPEIEMIVAKEDASFTQMIVDNMLSGVWQAIFLAAIIIFLFLGSLSRGLVVAVSMPMTFLLTFAGMKVFNVQLDLVTLSAIILAVGMVVDASVVVLENITRHYRERKISAAQAAAEGAKEIQFAVVAGNLTTLIVLFPLLFLYGFIGKTFGPLAATMIIAFISSLLVALSLVPILTALVSRDGGKVEKFSEKISAPWNRVMDKVRDFYTTLLSKSLNKRWLVFLSVTILFAGSLMLLKYIGMELLPKMDAGTTNITIETTSGTSLTETGKIMEQVEAIIIQEPEVILISNQMGFEPGMHSFGGGGVQGPTQGYITLTLTPRTQRDESIWEIQDRLREKIWKIPGLQNVVVRESGATAKSTTAASIMVSVKGEDPLVLNALGDEVMRIIRPIPGVVNPYREWRIDQKSIELSIDTERAREMGMTPVSAANELVRSLDGMNAGTFRDMQGDDTPIRVRYDIPFRQREKDAYEVRTISSTDGQVVPMGSIVNGKEIMVQGLVTTENLEPTLDILALHQNRALNFVTADVAKEISKINVPNGYKVGLSGEDKDLGEAKSELTGAMMMALIAIYLLLVAQFRSFIHPVTVMMSVPLSLIGVAIALWIGGKTVSMIVMVAMILLVGIVVNNSIILLDFIRQRREDGAERREAIVESVAARFRPIMMTSLSTIIGMTPLAMELALGAEKFSPLAIAVIGGMTASTFLTMVVIPVVYDSFESAAEFLKGLRTKRSVITN